MSWNDLKIEKIYSELPKYQKIKNLFYWLKHRKKRFVLIRGLDFGLNDMVYSNLCIHDRKMNKYYVIESQMYDITKEELEGMRE